ncbi:MAG: ribonuclease P protein component [Bdellovibrionales bacterium]|nr:ribonuclease P protein component [Bdellovibrionales bacterium]
MANKIIPLSLKKDFTKLYEEGAVLKKGGIVLRCVKNKKGLRVAFGLSGKIVRTAVKRNRIKRWSRQILREAVFLKKISLDILITVVTEQKSYERFKKNFEYLLEQTL